MVLGKLLVPGRPTNLDYSRARTYCACSKCEWVVWIFFLLSIISLFFLPLSGRLDYCPLSLKQPTNFKFKVNACTSMFSPPF